MNAYSHSCFGFTNTGRRDLRDSLLAADDFSIHGPDSILHCRWVAANRDRHIRNQFTVIWPQEGGAVLTGTYDHALDQFGLDQVGEWSGSSRDVFKLARDWIWDHAAQRLRLDAASA